MYADIQIQKSKCFKSLNFIKLQFRIMSLSDSGSIRIKGGKNNLGTLIFFSVSLQFTSSVIKTFILRGKLGSLRKLKSGHSASLSSRPGYAPSALGLWKNTVSNRKKSSHRVHLAAGLKEAIFEKRCVVGT